MSREMGDSMRAVSFEGDHQVLLPSLNLALDLDEASVLRFAASRSITRPSLADLRAATVPASVLVASIYERGAAAVALRALVIEPPRRARSFFPTRRSIDPRVLYITRTLSFHEIA